MNIFSRTYESDCRKENVPILVKLLLSIDRSKGFDTAKKIVDLTISLGHTRNDVVVGLDVSGNMADSDITDYFPLLFKIKDAGLKLTGNIYTEKETQKRSP